MRPTDGALPGDPSLVRAMGMPAPPGPGVAPGNAERAAAQSDPGSIGGGTVGRPERYLLVVVHRDPAGDRDAPRYLLVRWHDWPRPALLSLAPPADAGELEEALRSLLGARLGVAVASRPQLAPERVPARMSHPRTGVEGLGWLRAAAVEVTGEPAPDALLAGVDAMEFNEALAALSTEVERIVFRAGAAVARGS